MGYDDKDFSLRLQRTEFEMDTPMGKKTVQFGGYAGNFSLTYRGEDLRASSAAGLRKRIQRVEDEFQMKKAADTLRREVAKNPEEATLLLFPRDLRRGKTASPLVLEDVHVRGVDQRSGYALITRADGSRESHPWGDGNRRWTRKANEAYVGGDAVLRPLEANDRAEILSAYQRLRDAEQEAAAKQGPLVKKVLPQVRYGVPIEVTLDLETLEMVAVHHGVEYRDPGHDGAGRGPADLETVIRRAMLAEHGYFWSDEGDEARSLTEETSIRLSTNVYKASEDVQAYFEAARAIRPARNLYYEVVTEYLFDKSLVIPQEAASESAEGEEHVALPNIHAPEQQDWED